MSGDYFRPATSPVARVRHICIGCGIFIEKGEKYHRQTGFFDGLAFCNKLHFECRDQLEASSDGGTYEFTPGECEPPEQTLAASPQPTKGE